MTTTHQYLDIYPISPESTKLIVGTIHPHNHQNFEIPFFYGNRLSIWKILDEAFPGEMAQPISLDGVLEFLKKKKISVSDTIIQCDRKNDTALDKDLIPKELNYEIIDQIKYSAITEILFTSAFGKNNAFKLFYVDILKQEITKNVRDDRGILLDNSFFGRPVQLTILYSPSGAANTGLVNSKLYIENKHKYTHSNRPVQDFKINYYKAAFS